MNAAYACLDLCKFLRTNEGVRGKVLRIRLYILNSLLVQGSNCIYVDNVWIGTSQGRMFICERCWCGVGVFYVKWRRLQGGRCQRDEGGRNSMNWVLMEKEWEGGIVKEMV